MNNVSNRLGWGYHLVWNQLGLNRFRLIALRLYDNFSFSWCFNGFRRWLNGSSYWRLIKVWLLVFCLFWWSVRVVLLLWWGFRILSFLDFNAYWSFRSVQSTRNLFWLLLCWRLDWNDWLWLGFLHYAGLWFCDGSYFGHWFLLWFGFDWFSLDCWLSWDWGCLNRFLLFLWRNWWTNNRFNWIENDRFWWLCWLFSAWRYFFGWWLIDVTLLFLRRRGVCALPQSLTLHLRNLFLWILNVLLRNLSVVNIRWLSDWVWSFRWLFLVPIKDWVISCQIFVIFLQTHWNYVRRLIYRLLWAFWLGLGLGLDFNRLGLFSLLNFLWFLHFVLGGSDVVLVHSVVLFCLLRLWLSPIDFSLTFWLLFWGRFPIWSRNYVNFKLWRFRSHLINLFLRNTSFEQKRHTREESGTGIEKDLSEHLHRHILSFRYLFDALPWRTQRFIVSESFFDFAPVLSEVFRTEFNSLSWDDFGWAGLVFVGTLLFWWDFQGNVAFWVIDRGGCFNNVCYFSNLDILFVDDGFAYNFCVVHDYWFVLNDGLDFWWRNLWLSFDNWLFLNYDSFLFFDFHLFSFDQFSSLRRLIRVTWSGDVFLWALLFSDDFCSGFYFYWWNLLWLLNGNWLLLHGFHRSRLWFNLNAGLWFSYFFFFWTQRSIWNRLGLCLTLACLNFRSVRLWMMMLILFLIMKNSLLRWNINVWFLLGVCDFQGWFCLDWFYLNRFLNLSFLYRMLFWLLWTKTHFFLINVRQRSALSCIFNLSFSIR